MRYKSAEEFTDKQVTTKKKKNAKAKEDIYVCVYNKCI